MDHGFVARKAVHLSAPLFLVYYMLPSPLWQDGPTREAGLLVAFSLTMAFELSRLVMGFRVPGMRDYEAQQISAGAWAAIALTLALLFFPLELTAPIIIGMAFVDPLIGLVRRTRWFPWLPYALHLAIMLGVLSLFFPLTLWIIMVSMAISAIAIAAESIRTSYVDDDFLMIVLPLIGLSLLIGV